MASSFGDPRSFSLRPPPPSAYREPHPDNSNKQQLSHVSSHSGVVGGGGGGASSSSSLLQQQSQQQQYRRCTYTTYAKTKAKTKEAEEKRSRKKPTVTTSIPQGAFVDCLGSRSGLGTGAPAMARLETFLAGHYPAAASATPATREGEERDAAAVNQFAISWLRPVPP